MLCLVAQSYLTLCDPKDWSLPGSPVHGDSPGKNTGVGYYAPLQGIVPTQGWNPSLPHCSWILYCLSHQGSPRILEWAAYPFSRGSSQPSNWTRVSSIAGGFVTSWATKEDLEWHKISLWTKLKISQINTEDELNKERGITCSWIICLNSVNSHYFLN